MALLAPPHCCSEQLVLTCVCHSPSLLSVVNRVPSGLCLLLVPLPFPASCFTPVRTAHSAVCALCASNPSLAVLHVWSNPAQSPRGALRSLFFDHWNQSFNPFSGKCSAILSVSDDPDRQ